MDNIMDKSLPREHLDKFIHRIQGKIVVIAGLYGSTHGVGKETALLCAEQGANIVVADTDEDALADVVAAVEAAGGIAAHKVTEIRDQRSVNELFKFVVSSFGRVDVVVNVVGTGGEEHISMTDAEREFYFDSELVGFHTVLDLGLQYLEMNKESDLKTVVAVNTPAVGNVRERVVPTLKALVTESVERGIKVGTVFPWFGVSVKASDRLREILGPAIRPPLPFVAKAVLFVATDPDHSGCMLVLTDYQAIDMVEYGAVERIREEIRHEVTSELEKLGHPASEGSEEDLRALIAKLRSGSESGSDTSAPQLPDSWNKYAEKARRIADVEREKNRVPPKRERPTRPVPPKRERPESPGKPVPPKRERLERPVPPKRERPESPGKPSPPPKPIPGSKL